MTITPQDDGHGNLSTLTKVERVKDKVTGEQLPQPELIGTWDSSKPDGSGQDGAAGSDAAKVDVAANPEEGGAPEAKSGTPRVPFENSYKAAPGVASFAGFSKFLTGRDWTAQDSFTFKFEQTLYVKDQKEYKPGQEGFELAPIPDAIVKADSPTGENGEKLFGFTDVKYAVPGVYRYRLYEVIPNDAVNADGVTYAEATAEQKKAGGFTKDGITYSSHEFFFSMTVIDFGLGTNVVVGPIYANGPDDPASSFTNAYGSNSSSVELSAVFAKKLTGRSWLSSDSFTFEMRAKDPAAAPMPAGAVDGVATATVTGNGAPAQDTISFGFGQISYTLEDLQGAESQPDGSREKVFTYEVREVIPHDAVNAAGTPYDNAKEEERAAGGFAKDGIVYDGHVALLRVHVSDDGKGGLNAAPVVTLETEGALFENAYSAAGEFAIAATKVLEGRPLVEDEFSFNLTLEPADADGGKAPRPVEAVTNKADGSVAFAPIKLTVDDLKQLVADGYAKDATTEQGARTWTLAYRVAEDVSKLPAGVTASRQSFNVAVTLTDAGNGKLDVAVAYPDAPVASARDAVVPAGAELRNVYSTGDPIAVTPVGLKRLEHENGLSPQDIAGKFTFTLEALDGGPLPSEPDRTATNDAAGNVTFGPITFTLEHLGVSAAEDRVGVPREKTFTYRVVETGSAAGVTNDADAKTFTYTLRDDGAGNLSVTSSPIDGPLFTFVNTYAAAPVDVVFKAQKVLQGRDLMAGEFEFALVEQGENASVLTATNDEKGAVEFDKLTFNAPGTYVYSIAELEGSSSSVVYDKSVFTVKIDVRDGGEGKLIADVTMVDAEGNMVEGGVATFTNIYVPPVGPGPDPDPGPDPEPGPGPDPQPEPEPEPNPEPDPEPGPTPPVDPNKPPAGEGGSSEQGGNKLPTTGDAAEIVPLVVAAGIGACATGFALRRKMTR